MRRYARRHGFTLLELGVVMAMIAILAAILFPVFRSAQEAARKSSCMDHLYQIGLALQVYAHDHDTRLPPRHNDLRPLIGGYLSDFSLLECGTDSAAAIVREANAAAARTERAYSSYQYRGGLSGADRPDVPVAADWALIHQGLVNVLKLDGSVKALRAQTIQPVSFGPRVFPRGVVVPIILDPPTPYLNDPPEKLVPASPPAASGE